MTDLRLHRHSVESVLAVSRLRGVATAPQADSLPAAYVDGPGSGGQIPGMVADAAGECLTSKVDS